MRIEQVMRRDLARIAPEEPLSRLVEWYANPGGRSRYTYVVDANGRLLGVVTMLELLNAFMDGGHGQDSSDEQELARIGRALEAKKCLPVSTLMRADLPTVAPDAPLLAARPLLRERGVTALPVVDAAGRLKGEVTRRLLLRLLDAMLRDPGLAALRTGCTQPDEGTGSEFFVG
ncbi:CBS domain-containing protein [Humidesulfovibrio mexicanus]|uniref:CBS domain-containing protein n=1 Tax=Humidesulfovibrio mexicanus TaxID=147047 RepID=A0A239CD92_9BACT|nr:CBS domain-containing protein [Humidesulfovibrio mexicanus]SNS17434.1 CBS domain-containing protein [Humidesulfovibrio mexicanus]